MMIIDGSVIVSIGTFLRQAHELALTRYKYEDILLEDDLLSSYGDALEAACLHTLRTFCDTDMCTHAYRSANMAEMVGYALNLSRQELVTLRIAALLHDIGKIAVPAPILYKPGSLDSSERAYIQMHPQLGQRILQLAGESFLPFIPIVLTHHEFWDGSGYPHGLYGEAIPLLTRIITVVDSYDAMVSLRVYGKPQSVMQAHQELLRCAGQQFDPNIVSAFLALFDSQPAQQSFYDAETALSPRYPTSSDVARLALAVAYAKSLNKWTCTGWRNVLSAFTSIWRIRSRVSLKWLLNSSRVWQ